MSDAKPPTQEEMDEALECGPPEPGYAEPIDLYCVETKNTGTWRWGVVKSSILHRVSDDTYWRMSYRQASGDGEDPDEPATVHRVYPYQKTITAYSTKPQETTP